MSDNYRSALDNMTGDQRDIDLAVLTRANNQSFVCAPTNVHGNDPWLEVTRR